QGVVLGEDQAAHPGAVETLAELPDAAQFGDWAFGGQHIPGGAKDHCSAGGDGGLPGCEATVFHVSVPPFVCAAQHITVSEVPGGRNGWFRLAALAASRSQEALAYETRPRGGVRSSDQAASRSSGLNPARVAKVSSMSTLKSSHFPF